MRQFIVKFTKALPFIHFLVCEMAVIANHGQYGSAEDTGWAIFWLSLAVLLSTLCVKAFSYVVEAACLYLENNKKNENS